MASGPCLDDICLGTGGGGKGECVARVSLATWATFLASPVSGSSTDVGSSRGVHTALYANSNAVFWALSPWESQPQTAAFEKQHMPSRGSPPPFKMRGRPRGLCAFSQRHLVRWQLGLGSTARLLTF